MHTRHRHTRGAREEGLGHLRRTTCADKGRRVAQRSEGTEAEAAKGASAVRGGTGREKRGHREAGEELAFVDLPERQQRNKDLNHTSAWTAAPNER